MTPTGSWAKGVNLTQNAASLCPQLLIGLAGALNICAAKAGLPIHSGRKKLFDFTPAFRSYAGCFTSLYVRPRLQRVPRRRS